MYFTIQQLLKTCVQGETNKDLNESGVEDRHLVAGFENNCVADGRFERVVTQNFFRNRQISSETSETQEPPQKWFSFRKRDERG